ncbi:substrate-binding domain-containing protein [Polynucleobacter necessarius]|uniref:substrate-binding domain-containing protein n=1 Tax=Polynucleobacter necessarius TaxID=576610 RepID=UPI0018D56BBA
MNGAPFNLFISADERFPLELYKNGKTVDQGMVYAIGKIAMITKNSSGIKLVNDKAELARAIAKPELAPYGKAAVEYMKAEGLWDLAKWYLAITLALLRCMPLLVPQMLALLRCLWRNHQSLPN